MVLGAFLITFLILTVAFVHVSLQAGSLLLFCFLEVVALVVSALVALGMFMGRKLEGRGDPEEERLRREREQCMTSGKKSLTVLLVGSIFSLGVATESGWPLFLCVLGVGLAAISAIAVLLYDNASRTERKAEARWIVFIGLALTCIGLLEGAGTVLTLVVETFILSALSYMIPEKKDVPSSPQATLAP